MPHKNNLVRLVRSPFTEYPSATSKLQLEKERELQRCVMMSKLASLGRMNSESDPHRVLRSSYLMSISKVRLGIHHVLFCYTQFSLKRILFLFHSGFRFILLFLRIILVFLSQQEQKGLFIKILSLNSYSTRTSQSLHILVTIDKRLFSSCRSVRHNSIADLSNLIFP